MTISFTAKTLPRCLRRCLAHECSVRSRWTDGGRLCVCILPPGLILPGRQRRGPPGAAVTLLASVMNWVLSHLQQQSLTLAYPSRPMGVEYVKGRKKQDLL